MKEKNEASEMQLCHPSLLCPAQKEKVAHNSFFVPKQWNLQLQGPAVPGCPPHPAVSTDTKSLRSPGVAANAYNPSHLGGRDQEDQCSRPARTNSY
jgi:hypothetical protein